MFVINNKLSLIWKVCFLWKPGNCVALLDKAPYLHLGAQLWALNNIWIKKVLCSRGQGGSLCSKNVVRSRQNIQSLVAFCHWVRDTCQLFDSERIRSISEITPSLWWTYVHATRSRDSPRPCGPGNARKARLPSCSLSTCFSRHTLYMEDHICSITTRCLLEQTAYEESNIGETFSWATIFSLITLSRVGRGDCTVMRALAAHRCGPGSIPKHGVTCGLNLLFVLVLAPTVFLQVFRFPPQHKPTFQIQISVGSIE